MRGEQQLQPYVDYEDTHTHIHTQTHHPHTHLIRRERSSELRDDPRRQHDASAESREQGPRRRVGALEAAQEDQLDQHLAENAAGDAQHGEVDDAEGELNDVSDDWVNRRAGMCAADAVRVGAAVGPGGVWHEENCRAD